MLDLSNDLQVLAATIYGEARGEPLAGKQAVGCVIRNRVARSAGRPQFGTGTFASACLAPWQFSCWNENDPNRAVLDALDFGNPPDDLFFCIEVAQDIIADRIGDPTFGSNNYKVTSLPWPRDWGPAILQPRAVIGHHSFYFVP